jgi:hypothetical protein
MATPSSGLASHIQAFLPVLALFAFLRRFLLLFSFIFSIPNMTGEFGNYMPSLRPVNPLLQCVFFCPFII